MRAEEEQENIHLEMYKHLDKRESSETNTLNLNNVLGKIESDLMGDHEPRTISTGDPI